MPNLDGPSPLAKFSVPHQFTPELSFYGAILAVAAALTQIVGGCTIGALWGVCIWMAAASAHSTAWKSATICALAGGMIACLLGLWFGVHRAVVFFEKKRAA